MCNFFQRSGIDCDKQYDIGSDRLKQFIRYLYEYEQGKRCRNVGFVKVEQLGRESTIHIHGKGLRMSSGEGLRVYLFFDDAGTPTSVPQGEIAYMGPAINYRLKYTDEDTGIPENYEKINGILLESRNRRRFAALWEETPFDIDHMVQWSKAADEARAVPPAQESERETPGEIRTEPETEIESEEELGMAAESGAEMQMGMTLQAEPEIEPEEESEPEMESEEEPKSVVDLEAGAEAQTEDAEETPSWRAVKIQRNEISRLPRCEWRLANNNFLMHGYHNYKYLVLLDNGRTLKLGIPGIYHEKEARAASGFGFPEFISINETGLAGEPDDCEEGRQFGFWCRQVRRPMM